jgi:hypothetical protein
MFLFVAALCLRAQDSSSKTGGFCFRVDDQHPSALWAQYRELFRKRANNFSFAVNLGLTPLDAGMLQTLVADGHELMDHSPEHNTLYFSDTSTANYKGVKGVDHIVYGIDRICLSINSIDTLNSPGEIWMNIRDGLGYPVNSDGFSSSILEYPILGIYSPERRMFFRMTSYKEQPGAIAVVTLWSAWNEPVSVGSIDSVRFRLIHLYDVSVSDEGIALLAQRTSNLCKQYGLPNPTAWIQPGAPNPYLPADQVKRVFGGKYQYTVGATYRQAALDCYNDVDPANARFAMDHDVNLDSASFEACKKVIADRSARHYISIGLSHFFGTSQNSRAGDWQAHLDKTDSLLAWCKRKKIPVKTYRDLTRILYDTPQDPYTNVFPDLNTDLDEDGKPDGYSMINGEAGGSLDRTDGVPESGGVSYAIGTIGTICHVRDLGGLEKGLNAFSFSTKGTGGSVEVTFTLHSSTDIVRRYVFPVTTTKWKRNDTTLIIPNDVSTCDVLIKALQVGPAPIRISGMSLAKAGTQIALTARTITTSAGPNGSIAPSGAIQLINGASQSFAITPNNGYKVLDVLVDSVSVGPVLSYTFSDVAADHRISVSFRPSKKPMAITEGATEVTPTSTRINGAVSPNGLVTTYHFEFGLTSSYGVATPTFSAPSGSALIQVSNLMSYLTPGTPLHYRIVATNSDGSSFGNDTTFTTMSNIRTITATTGLNGTITPSGIVQVSHGGSQTFVFTPDDGYRVAKVMVDDSLVGGATHYDFSNVTKDETISVSFVAMTIASGEQSDNEIPHSFALSQNYPNPFNPSTTIRFAVPIRSSITLKVYSVLGTEVATLIAKDLGPGRYSATWIADVPSGTYFYELRTNEFVETKKMILLR